MFRFLAYLLAFLFIVFILPALAHFAWWATLDHPKSWSSADWSSASVLPKTPASNEAGIWVMSARTGGLKGAFATHSWIVVKKPGQSRYDRYEVVGWGTPLRRNAYPADARWYSNPPRIDHHIAGAAAREVIPKLETAVNEYRWRRYGDYTLWPGPNSNTFVATVLRAVPELRTATPATAVGRDFPADERWFGRRADGSLFASIGGYAGVTFGGAAGFEMNFLGLVVGITPDARGVKLPGFGTLRPFTT